MNLCLMRHGFPPLRIQPSDRLDYCDSANTSAFELWIAEREKNELAYWLLSLK